MDYDKLETGKYSFWILHTSGWLFLMLATVIYAYPGKWTDFPQLAPYLFTYLVAFLTCLPLRYFYKKTRFHEWPWKYSLLTGIVGSFVAANVWLGIDLGISVFLHQAPYIRNPQAFGSIYPMFILRRGIPLLGWSLLYLGIKIGREWKQQEQRTEKASLLAQTAKLQMLRYQLNPHFLFNAMNSIRALIDENETKAKDLITELSEFLRYSLDSRDQADVPLKQEIEAIKHYFAIQKKRYEDKLEVNYAIEPQAAEFPVLSFLVHPLIENAVKYGMRTSPMPLIVSLRAKVRDDTLVIEVINTGKWVEPVDQEPQASGTGTGLDNVRLRLENAYSNNHRFEVVAKQGHVCIQLEIRNLRRINDEKASKRPRHR